jgi:hypothetical protein
MQLGQLNVVLAFALLGVWAQTNSSPTKMTHMIVQMSGTDIAKDSFAAQPKIYWRASNQYCSR